MRLQLRHLQLAPLIDKSLYISDYGWIYISGYDLYAGWVSGSYCTKINTDVRLVE